MNKIIPSLVALYARAILAQEVPSRSVPFPQAPTPTGPTTTQSILFLETDPQSLVGSVIAADASKTTYLVGCAPSTNSADSGECGVFGETITVGASAFDMHMTDGDFTASEHCDMSGTVPTACRISLGGADANDPGVNAISPVPTDFYAYLPVNIVQGVEKLASASASPTSGAASPSGSSGSPAKPGNSAPSSGASATAGAPNSATSPATAQNTNAASRNGGSKLLGGAIGVGAVAAIGLI